MLISIFSLHSKIYNLQSNIDNNMTVDTHTSIKRKSFSPYVYDILFIFILIAAAYFRFTGLQWGENQYLHPDERFLIWVGTDIQPIGTPQSVLGSPPNVANQTWRAAYINDLPDCQKWGGYFDASCSPLNPHNRGHTFYVYGTFPMFITRYLVQAFFHHSSFENMTLIGRALSALFDLGTIFLVYLIGIRLYQRRVGLLAAAFSACAVCQIQQSHFFTMDTFVTFFAILAVYFAVCVAKSDWHRRNPFHNIVVNGDEPTGSAGDIDLLESEGSHQAYRTGLSETLVKDYILRFVKDPLCFYSIGFGVALGMAVASKVSTGLVALLLPVAMIIGLFRLDQKERARRVVDAVVYLGIAAVVSLLVFRVLQPYAFIGPGFFGLKPNPAWLGNLKELSNLTTGDVDYPPAMQWARRPIWFALKNMVSWGMGIPLGVTAWVGFLWATWRMLKRKEWNLHILLWLWTGMNFVYWSLVFNPMMRYQVPVYPTLLLSAAWAIISIWDWSKTLSLSRGAVRLTQGLAIVLCAGVLLTSAGYAYAFTQMYVRPITRIEASRWIYQNIPGPINYHIQTEKGLFNQPQPLPNGIVLQPGIPFQTSFKSTRNGSLGEIAFAHVVDRLDAPGEKTLSLSISDKPDISTPLGQGSLVAEFLPDGDLRGDGYLLTLDQPITLIKGEIYYLQLTVETNNGQLAFDGSSIAVEGAWDDPLPVRLDELDGYGGIYQGYAFDMYDPDEPQKLTRFLNNLNRSDYLTISSSRQWGSLPRIPERYPLSTEYYRYLMGCPPERSIEWCYSVAKPGMFQGDLGYDLVQIFQSNPRIGPVELNDQFAEEAFTVYDHPKVLIFQKRSDYNSEQVKTILSSVDLNKVVHLSPRKATLLMDRILPVNLVKIERNALSAAPSNAQGTSPSSQKDMLLPADRLVVQRTGGTWSALFNTDAIYNRFPALGAILWYLAVFLLGLVVYPILRIALPGLSDHGYPLARTAGLLILSYLVWLVGSFNIPFSRLTISIVFVILVLLAAFLGYLQRDGLRREWREGRRYYLLIEGLFLAFFLLDLMIRLGNPDLWHAWKGGEKPMDFSYFNAILKSTTFPPYDPWFAGGYINYYYYGFVLVGVLVKWLGIVPSIAYNLILPTIFALIAMGAFSIGWNLIKSTTAARGQGSISELEQVSLEINELGSKGAWEQTTLSDRGVESRSAGEQMSAVEEDFSGGEIIESVSKPVGVLLDSTSYVTGAADLPVHVIKHSTQNTGHTARITYLPLLVGLSAALGMALFGNLGTVRMIYQGWQRLVAPNGNIDNVSIPTHLIWAAQGMIKNLSGTSLPYGTDSWYWDPSRVIPPQFPGEITPITEFPFFTVLYGDPHAHLYALPLSLLALGWILSMVLGKGWKSVLRNEDRNLSDEILGGKDSNQGLPRISRFSALITDSFIPIGLSLILGGMVIGALYPTNTWDLPTYLVLGVFALGYSLWKNFQIGLPASPQSTENTVTKSNGNITQLIVIFGSILWLVILAVLLYQPYTHWYVAGYTKVELWQGTHTPFWSYLTHWGLFLFIIVSWMVWETITWMASTPISALRKLFRYQMVINVAALALVVCILLLFSIKVGIGWLVLGLMAWCLILILRPGMPDAKRIVLFLVGTGLALTLAVEVVRLAGDIERMNTVFKFYLQVWTLFSVSAAAALGWLLPELTLWKRGWRTSWQVVLVILVASVALYPLMAGMTKIKDRMTSQAPHTLDGMAYMQYATYDDLNTTLDLSQDYRAIRWMQENVIGSPVIVEANTVEYHWGSRFTIYTGLPGVVGWNWHQRQQRALTSEIVQQRVNEVGDFYHTTDRSAAQVFLNKYDIRYVIVGQLERHLYPVAGIEKFELLNGVLWSAVYRDGEMVIYQVIQ